MMFSMIKDDNVLVEYNEIWIIIRGFCKKCLIESLSMKINTQKLKWEYLMMWFLQTSWYKLKKGMHCVCFIVITVDSFIKMGKKHDQNGQDD